METISTGNKDILIKKEDLVSIGVNAFSPKEEFVITAEKINKLSENLLVNQLPEKYIINKNATILFWGDESKTVIKRNITDEYDKKLAFLIAYFQKHSGLSKTQANKYLNSLADEDEIKIRDMLQNETVIDTISDIFGNVGKVFINISENMKGE